MRTPKFQLKMEWYKITEIEFTEYVKCLKELYPVVEGKTNSNGTVDPMKKKILQSHSGMSESQWDEAERVRLLNNILTMKIGKFHEELAGKFKGYRTLKPGHETCCDVCKEDGTEIWEWKNSGGTMNANAGESIYKKLMTQHNLGVKVFLVEVNCPKGKVRRHKLPESISVMNGVQAYEYLSGRASFFDDLLSTIGETFCRFKTWSEIQKFVAQLPAPI